MNKSCCFRLNYGVQCLKILLKKGPVHIFKIIFYLLLFVNLITNTFVISVEATLSAIRIEETEDSSGTSLISFKISPKQKGETLTTIEESSETSKPLQEYKFGTWSYYSSEPITIEYHLKEIDQDLRREIYWLYEYCWDMHLTQKKFQTLSPLDEEYATLKKDIQDNYKVLNHLSNRHYVSARQNIFEYVDPCYMPKDLAWRLGILLAHYENFRKGMIFWDLDETENNFEDDKEENAKSLNLIKISLLYFSYYLGLTDCLPPILQYDNLEAIASDPEFSTYVDTLFENAFIYIDETAWIFEMQKLDHQRLENICNFFRCFYRRFLQHKDTLPKFYKSLAAHLCGITTKVFLSLQANGNYNFDAINPWMFKLYIDLKKWDKLIQQDNDPVFPDLSTLLLIVQKKCLNLLPVTFTLEEITEENEFAICEEVRMKNLLPHNQSNLDKGEEIIDEFEFSPVAIRKALIYILDFFDHKARFAKGYYVGFKEFKEITQQIYNYLSGYMEMDEMSINENNALEYLFEVKLFDLIMQVWNSHYHVDYEYYGGMHYGYIGFDKFYFPRSTYELRKHILKMCPHLYSYEAFTISVNPEKVRDEKDETTPCGWVEESEKLRQRCIDDLLISAQYLSEMMAKSPLQGIIVGTRGISGAGKSTFLKKNILPLILPEDQKDPKNIDILFKGILNPDILKATLKKLQGNTLNKQVHEEASSAFNQVFRNVVDNGDYIIDKRQLTPQDIKINLLEPAKNGGRSVWLYDFDISLTACICRILARPLHGEEPCPAYEALVDGFLSARRYRKQVISLAINEDSIAKYELYATCKQHLVAQKVSGELAVYDPSLYYESLKEPTFEEIETELSQVIDDTFIFEAIAREDIGTEQCESLEKWKGMSLKKAIQLHVQGGKGFDDENLYEPTEVLPFKGEEWLGDLPHIITYLKSEHLLHTGGIDEQDGGLYWEGVDRGLNPKYAPEAKAPGYTQSGIQMKIGYFIVPMENMELHFSKNLSPTVARELTIRDESGKLIGLRFFVHPEAYAHFAPLLQANIPFVPPSKSEFMGTPTSSYNSWLIRCITSKDRTPFIVKMGTPNGPNDIGHLLSGDDIVKSISVQKSLGELPEQPNFLFFNETAGLILKSIPYYPMGTVDSGIVICELSEKLLT